MAERALTYTERRKGGGAVATPGATTVRGMVAGGSAWHPTVVNLLILVVLEIVAYGVLRYAFRQFHGG